MPDDIFQVVKSSGVEQILRVEFKSIIPQVLNNFLWEFTNSFKGFTNFIQPGLLFRSEISIPFSPQQSIILRRLLSVELAFSSYFKSFSCTKYTPRRLSSADAILALLPTTILLIVVQNIFQVTSVSRITASAREERTFSKVFSISRIFHLRWNAVSNVKTFWSDVFMVPITDKFEGMRTLWLPSP